MMGFARESQLNFHALPEAKKMIVETTEVNANGIVKKTRLFFYIIQFSCLEDNGKKMKKNIVPSIFYFM